MKRVFFLCSIVVLLLSLSACRDGNWRYPLSQEDALEMTRHLWEEYDLVLVSKDIVPGGTTMEENFKTSVVCESDSWVIVADTKYYMFAIGEAKWLYIIVNKNTGKISQSYHVGTPFVSISFDYIKKPLDL